MYKKYEYPINKNEFDELYGDYELFNFGAQISDIIFFKIDIVHDTIRFLGSNLKFFKNREVIKNYVDVIERNNLIHKDDKVVFEQAVEKLKLGISAPVSFRLQYSEQKIIWYSIAYTIILDEKNKPTFAIGKMNNIQESKELEDKASVDLLTSCLNKVTFESYTKTLINLQKMDPSVQHAFMIIDIDNFKSVNDNLGHFFGDILLKEISGKIKRIFRETDFIGRIGGDEFAVIMKNITDEKIIIQKMGEILEELEGYYQGENTKYHVSGSIGVALFPRDGQIYEEIYQNADAALYQSKYTGKNKFTIFNKNIVKGTMVNTTPFDVAHRALSHYFDQEIAMDVFNLLFEDDNYEASVTTVLQLLGKRFHVDRCYVFEFSPYSELTYDNTYEWCSNAMEPQIDYLQNVEVEIFTELFANANEEGVFYSNDLETVDDQETYKFLAAQGIRSFLHNYIKRNGVVSYAIGFDDCTSKRVWTPNEISTLMYASKIIAQFLSYRRAVVSIYRKSKENLQVLDSLNFYAYIVDAKNYSLKYANNITREIVPCTKVGEKCYSVFQDCDRACKHCPVKVLEEHPEASKVKMIVHNSKLNLELLVTASKIVSYDGKESIFVSATDIKAILDVIPEGSIYFENYLEIE